MRGLDELDLVDWGALSHAYGDASDIPGLLRSAPGDLETFGELLGSLCHQGTRCSAAAPAVAFVAGLAADADPETAMPALMLLGNLAIGEDDGYALPRPAEAQGIGDADALAAYRAVRDEVPGLLGQIGHPDDHTSAAATWLVSWFPDLAGQTLPTVQSGRLGPTTTLARGLLGDATLHSGGWPEAAAAMFTGDPELARWAVDAVLAEARARRGKDLFEANTPYASGDVAAILASALSLVPDERLGAAVGAVRTLADRVRASRDPHTASLARVQAALDRLETRS